MSLEIYIRLQSTTSPLDVTKSYTLDVSCFTGCQSFVATSVMLFAAPLTLLLYLSIWEIILKNCLSFSHSKNSNLVSLFHLSIYHLRKHMLNKGLYKKKLKTQYTMQSNTQSISVVMRIMNGSGWCIFAD